MIEVLSRVQLLGQILPIGDLSLLGQQYLTMEASWFFPALHPPPPPAPRSNVNSDGRDIQLL